MRWLLTAAVVALGFAFLWYVGILQSIWGAFRAWLVWIGAT
jgi:hypothetical protein